ncbi:hypothetical protein HDV05_003423 [Chytridiales sp. JEL 0842]|nr:hypothetical protein HDV05_003423 [Chytridiales sp. JEL 0842]
MASPSGHTTSRLPPNVENLDIVKLLLQHFPQLSSSIYESAMRKWNANIVREPLKAPGMVTSERSFIKLVVDSPVSVCKLEHSMAVFSETILTTEEFGKAWIIASCIDMDWSKLRAKDAMRILRRAFGMYEKQGYPTHLAEKIVCYVAPNATKS